jgi:hypothetical protein
VFYRSNRGGKDGKQIDFAADLPLWPWLEHGDRDRARRTPKFAR